MYADFSFLDHPPLFLRILAPSTIRVLSVREVSFRSPSLPIFARNADTGYVID